MRGFMEQRRETFTVNEFDLFRFIQPVNHFFDEHRLFDAVRLGNVDVRKRSGDVTPESHEVPQRERCSMKV
jgi:hypothetical protein